MKNMPATLRTVLAASLISGGIGAVLALSAPGVAQAQGGPSLSFFIASAGSGNGANLGGLAGADKICQTLGAAAGAGFGSALRHAARASVAFLTEAGSVIVTEMSVVFFWISVG